MSRGTRRAAIAALVFTLGCGTQRYFLEGSDLERFMAAGPVTLELDRDQLMEGVPVPGPYRVVSGDLLEIRGPRVFAEPTTQTTGPVGDSVHLTRVDAEGSIQVPIAGRIAVQGKTLPEIEQILVDALHPKFLVNRPSIVAKIDEYHRLPVTVIGAVETPGIHELRSDRLSLFGALSAAGGILRPANLVVGARLIRVIKPPRDRTDGERPRQEIIALPVKGLNVPFSDVALQGGETIEVERYEPDTFTVVGLVLKPGAYDYPPEVTYNLMQAIAIAGGVDLVADPPYATIFRQDADGTILPATLEIDGNGLVQSSAFPIKPGDVIAIQHTPASWTRTFLSEIFSIRLNFVANPLD